MDKPPSITQPPSEELLAAEAEANRLRDVVDDMRVEVARITDNAATEIMKLKQEIQRMSNIEAGSYIRAIARILAYEEWPCSTPAERAAWADNHLNDETYLRVASAIASIRSPAMSTPGAETDTAEAVAALEALVHKLDEVDHHPAYKSVWTINQIHAGPYRAPNYREELKRARAALRSSAMPTSVQEAVAAERERCARIAEDWYPFLLAPEHQGRNPVDAAYSTARKYIAAAIRSPASATAQEG